MSTIIRDAIIRIKLEQQKAKLEAPDISPLERAAKAEKKAVEEVVKVKREGAAASSEYETTSKKAFEQSARHANEFGAKLSAENVRIVSNFREGGEGALRFARGLAFLSAEGGADLQRLTQKVAIAQGVFDVFAGGSKALVTLGATFGGPVAAGVGIATGAIVLGVSEWSKWQKAAEEATKAQERMREEAIRFEQQQQSAWEKQQQREGRGRRGMAEAAALRTQFAVTPEDRLAGMRGERDALAAEMGANERDRSRRLRSFSPKAFGGNEAEAFENLRKFGSNTELTIARDYEDRRVEMSRQQLDISRRMYETQEKQIREAGQVQQSIFGIGIGASVGAGAAGAMGFGGLQQAAASAGVATLAGQGAAETKRQLNEALEAQRAYTKEVVTVFTDAMQKLIQLEKDLEAGNAN